VPNPLDFASCATGGASSDLSPVDPFYALRYHFGMLLGVEDFETEQAYHRGKMRLHNAWLHGAGTVWGLGVSLTTAGDVQVAAGLALDAAGHELHLDGPACLNLGAWYAAHATEQAVIDAVTQGASDYGPNGVAEAGTVYLDAHVIVRFKACLAREVPALLEPCNGASADTAFSRVAETVELLLVPGTAPGWSLPLRMRAQRRPGPVPVFPPIGIAQKKIGFTLTTVGPTGTAPPTETTANDNYHRLRLLFGLDTPIPDPASTTTPPTPIASDQLVLQVLTEIATLPPAAQAPALLQSFRYFAALDEVDLQAPVAADGTRMLFPGGDNDALVLANLFRIRLVQDSSGSWAVTQFDPAGFPTLAVDNTPRLTLLPTWTIEELLNAAQASGEGAAAIAADAGGPRVSFVSFEDVPATTQSPNGQTVITVTLNKQLSPGTLGSGFSIAFRDISGQALNSNTNMNVWFPISSYVAMNGMDVNNPTVSLTVDNPQPFAALGYPNRLVLVRVVAFGTGPTPLLGADNIPLAGGRNSPPGTASEGHDYVAMVQRS
jgi:hypothetical protein